MKMLGWLLGLDDMSSIEAVEFSLAAPWVQQSTFWLFFGVVIAALGSVVFYRRLQFRGSKFARTSLGISRGLLLSLLLLTLAAPVLRITGRRVQQPTVFLVFDGTESMTLRDRLSGPEREALQEAVAINDEASSDPALPDDEPRSRLDYVRAALRREGNFVDQLLASGDCRVETFIFDGSSTSRLRKLTGDEERTTAKSIAGQLTTNGQVTALGAALREIRDKYGTGSLAAVVMVSDFDHNSGPTPVGADADSNGLGVPLYAVGVGAERALDIGVELLTDPKMKRAERTTLTVKVRQTGLDGQTVSVEVMARPLRGGEAEIEATSCGKREVRLGSSSETLEFPFTPEQSGLFEFIAKVDAIEGEVVTENNISRRQLNVIDDYLRLMFVAHEPTWEWRFIKEVFHRDRLVGTNGFRTYLSSSDPRVRESNVLFLPTLTPKRSEFFANDVIFLGDMPQSSLTPRFCEMVKEFVGTMGGGLVVVAGPRFGPGELKATELGDMLPVIVERGTRFRDEREFPLKLSPQSSLFPFMQLGESESEHRAAWRNLGELPWYHPVVALHEQATSLAEHPMDRCVDGKTPQPLIAIRRFGKGEVVYIGFNEMWRLRRKFGELYYRQYWSQLIYRLGMSHALGADKRFVANVDRKEYRVEERVTFTVEAYNEDYEPLTEDNVPDGILNASLIMPGVGKAGGEARALSVPYSSRGVFETSVPVFTAGSYRIRVEDPITGEFKERRFQVIDSSAERRSAVRDARLQEELARDSGGRAYDLTDVDALYNDLRLEPIVEHATRNHPLWSTPLWFMLVIGMMLGEWTCRRLVNLR